MNSLPAPMENEASTTFMARCMVDSNAIAQFPQQSMRSAACYKAWQNGPASLSAGEPPGVPAAETSE